MVGFSIVDTLARGGDHPQRLVVGSENRGLAGERDCARHAPGKPAWHGRRAKLFSLLLQTTDTWRTYSVVALADTKPEPFLTLFFIPQLCAGIDVFVVFGVLVECGVGGSRLSLSGFALLGGVLVF